MNIKEIAQAVGLLAKADPKIVDAMLSDVALEKAAQKLSASERVEDHWEEGQAHRSATKEQVKTGPSQEASGGGAEKMVKEYSNPAPQHGVTIDPEPLARMLAPIAASSKAILEASKATVDALIALKAQLSPIAEFVKSQQDSAAVAAKAAAEKAKKSSEGEEEEDEEEAEVVEINASRAKSLLAKAKELITRIKVLKSEIEDEDSGEKRRTMKAEVKALTKEAGSVLFKARTCAFAAGDDELKKAIRTAATKADINVVQEEEEEEEEEGEGKAKKSAETGSGASKAKSNDHGNQADSANKDGNQADHAKSIQALGDKVDGALKGLSMLQTDIKGMLDVVAGKSRISDAPVIDIAKAKATDISGIAERIEGMIDDGTLSQADGLAAKDILGQLRASQHGHIDASVVNARIMKSSTAIRDLFSSKAA